MNYCKKKGKSLQIRFKASEEDRLIWRHAW